MEMSNKAMFMVVFIGALSMAMMQLGAAQTAHVVGDNIGWTIPTNGAAAYSDWASRRTFNVGDILVFRFATNQHDVVRVPKASFDACSSSNSIGAAVMTGPANMTLDAAGDVYFICTFGRHCQAGQKLAVTVVSGTGGAPAPPNNRTPPSTPTTSPSPTSPSEPCPPTGSPTSSPTGRNTPSTPSSPDSASAPVIASFMLGVASVAFALFA